MRLRCPTAASAADTAPDSDVHDRPRVHWRTRVHSHLWMSVAALTWGACSGGYVRSVRCPWGCPPKTTRCPGHDGRPSTTPNADRPGRSPWTGAHEQTASSARVRPSLKRPLSRPRYWPCDRGSARVSGIVVRRCPPRTWQAHGHAHLGSMSVGAAVVSGRPAEPGRLKERAVRRACRGLSRRGMLRVAP